MLVREACGRRGAGDGHCAYGRTRDERHRLEFCILWDGKELHGLNASGRAPAAWSPAYFAGRESMPKSGWDTVTVPGCVSVGRGF